MLQLHNCQNLPMSWHTATIPLLWFHGQLHSIFPTDILSSTPVIFYVTHKCYHCLHILCTWIEQSLATPHLLLVLVAVVLLEWQLCLALTKAMESATLLKQHQQVQHICVISHYQYVLCISSQAPTGALGGLNITSVESRSLSVVWGNVPCSHQRGPIAGYRLHYTDDSSVAYTVKITGESNRWYQLTGLTPFTRYSIQVAAENGVGTGPYNDPPLNAETLEDCKCNQYNSKACINYMYCVLYTQFLVQCLVY